MVLSSVAFVWVSLEALGFLAIEPDWNWLFRILVDRAWLVTGTAVSCVSALLMKSYTTSRVAIVLDP